MATKYQVFVSSTFEDLRAERDVAIRAVLEMGHIPVGMEMFSAADEEQWKIIARHIDESDYYCVLVAHRYGSTAGGMSFTRKEYEYAVSVGVPVLGFILSDSASWPAHLIDTGEVELAGLKEFKDLVKLRPVSFWTSAEDLYGKVSIALGKAFTTSPREGWVRASGVAGPEVTRELTRLSAENSSLREQIRAMTASQELDKAAELTSLRQKLRSLTKVMSYKYASSDESWSKAEPLTYYQLFWLMAPELVYESEVSQCAADLSMNIRADATRSWWTCPVNQVRDLLTEFMALGLAEPSKRKHAVADNNEYWSLTELGGDLYRDVRLRQIEARLGQATSAVQNGAERVVEDQANGEHGESDMDADA